MPGVLNEIIQTALSGVATGCIYGLAALGFVLIYKATEVINFAQGEIMVLGAFLAYTLVTYCGLPYWAVLAITIVSLGLFGRVLERLVLRSLIGEPAFATVMLTVGLGIFIRATVSLVPGWGTDTYGFKTPFTDKYFHYESLVLSAEQLAVIFTTVILIILLYAFFRFSKAGVSMRGTSMNQLAAVYMGISVKRVFANTWTVAAALGGVAGILLAPITFVHVNMGFIGLKAFPAAVLGGFSSVPGSLVGGVIIGVIESFSGLYLPEGWKDVSAYIVLIGVLMIRPEGIFGKHRRKKV